MPEPVTRLVYFQVSSQPRAVSFFSVGDSVRWDRLDKETLDQIRTIEDPVVRLRTLFAEAMSAKRAQSLYLALAVSPSPDIGAALRKVSSRRLKLLATTYQELGMTDLAAQQQALLAYSANIGGVHLRSNDAPWLRETRDVHAYVEHASTALIEPARKQKAKRRVASRKNVTDSTM